MIKGRKQWNFKKENRINEKKELVPRKRSIKLTNLEQDWLINKSEDTNYEREELKRDYHYRPSKRDQKGCLRKYNTHFHPGKFGNKIKQNGQFL